MTKAYYRKSELADGYVPYHFSTAIGVNGDDCRIAWSQSYECWIPESCIGLNDHDGGLNMVLLIPLDDEVTLVWVNSLDFDFEE